MKLKSKASFPFIWLSLCVFRTMKIVYDEFNKVAVKVKE